MYTIGKSNKYYTLWNVTSQDLFDEKTGRKTGTKFIYTFYQNLSFDKNKAIEKAKSKFNLDTIKVDEDLRGHSSFTRTERIKPEEGQFTYGAYIGKYPSEVNDTKYLIYALNNKMFPKLNDEILKRLSELPDAIYFNDDYYHEDDIDEVKRKYEANKLERSLKSGHYFNQGDKVELNLTLFKNYGFSGQYGWTNIYIFYDENKKTFKYMGSKDFDIKVGETKKIKFTIKHKYYRDEPETFMLRPSII